MATKVTRASRSARPFEGSRGHADLETRSRAGAGAGPHFAAVAFRPGFGVAASGADAAAPKRERWSFS